jgi:malate synthase
VQTSTRLVRNRAQQARRPKLKARRDPHPYKAKLVDAGYLLVDVANHIGVSPLTLSRFLNRNFILKAETAAYIERRLAAIV